MTKDLSDLRALLNSIIELITSVANDSTLTDDDRVLLLEFEVFLGNLVTAINNKILQSQAAVIKSLRDRFADSAKQLDQVQQKIKALTTKLNQAQKVVDGFGNLIKKIAPAKPAKVKPG